MNSINKLIIAFDFRAKIINYTFYYNILRKKIVNNQHSQLKI